jgi:hypothetical protein
MKLKNKTILLISPQSWGEMFISKHHYAITLAKMGNKVYFLNPPEEEGNTIKRGGILIKTSCIHPNLLLIEHKIKFPFLLKFHAIPVFHWLMQFHIKKLLKKIVNEVDIVWSFDQGNLYPFSFFGTTPFKIFQPVDEPQNKVAIDAAKGSDLILSVTKEILEKYDLFEQPRHLINHGIGEDFLLNAVGSKHKPNIHVGFSGNLLRKDIDRNILLRIIRQNPDVVFECWGSYKPKHPNIGRLENESTSLFIQALQDQGVKLHGPAATPIKLAAELQRMDAFLICYDVQKDQSKGTNYHKIMEYLSTGKVIIANNISAYEDKPQFIQMVKERDSNQMLPMLFKKVINNLSFHNTPVLQTQRRAYARENTYVNHVDRIQEIIGQVYNNNTDIIRQVKPISNVYKGLKKLYQE